MWSFRNGKPPRPGEGRVRLALESLDPRCAASSLFGDAPNDPEEPILIAPPPNANPVIVDFLGSEVAQGLWRFTGRVIDETPGGLTIRFGGQPDSLQDMTTRTDANGYFDVTFVMNTDGSDNGMVEARTVDLFGAPSNIATDYIQPG